MENLVYDPEYKKIREELSGQLLDEIEKAEGVRPVIRLG